MLRGEGSGEAAAGAAAFPETVDTLAGLLREHCARVLKARIEQPPRADGDWSIPLPEGCRCELCRDLDAFLADPGQTRIEWPIAKDKRKHVHYRLNDGELPVSHETRRAGSPYTPALTKTPALFEREAATRRARQADLAWFTGG